MPWEQADEGLYLREPEKKIGDDANDTDLQCARHVGPQTVGVHVASVVLSLGVFESVNGDGCQCDGDGEGGGLLQPRSRAYGDQRATLGGGAEEAVRPQPRWASLALSETGVGSRK